MLIPVILSGGVGSRLWPLSRKTKPKHFMPLIEDNISDRNSLLQQTVLRCSIQKDSEYNPFTHNPVLVCDSEHRFLVSDQCAEINIQPEGILLEPERKDTAAAILLAVLYIYEKYPDAVVLVTPSDHYMSDSVYYLKRVTDAYQQAQDNIVTFGINPTYPETGYGYINADLSHDLYNDIYRVNRFIEKPNIEVAKKLLAAQDCLWNSGMFMFKAEHLINLCKEMQPELLHYCQQTIKTGREENNFVNFSNEYFSKISPLSIDYALMQDAKDMVVTRYSGQWADVGCWHGVWQNTPKDNDNNVVMGNVLLDDTENCYIRSDGRLIVTVGVDNLTVIETPDAVLVTRLDNSQELRNIVESSMQKQHKEFIEHSHAHRPWGEFIIIGDGEKYKVKKLVIKPGASLSLQSHEFRAEHWIVVEGQADVEKGDEKFHLTVNDTVFIPVGTKHRITNNHSIDNLVIIEVQIGNYLAEDDITRYEDIYGRVK